MSDHERRVDRGGRQCACAPVRSRVRAPAVHADATTRARLLAIRVGGDPFALRARRRAGAPRRPQDRPGAQRGAGCSASPLPRRARAGPRPAPAARLSGARADALAGLVAARRRSASLSTRSRGTSRAVGAAVARPRRHPAAARRSIVRAHAWPDSRRRRDPPARSTSLRCSTALGSRPAGTHENKER